MLQSGFSALLLREFMSTASDDRVEVPSMTLADFLVNYPPGRMAAVGSLKDSDWFNFCYQLPDIVLHCEACDGERTFQPRMESHKEDRRAQSGGNRSVNLQYRCRNCEESYKTFSLLYDPMLDGLYSAAIKIGEWPPFGPPTPARVITLVGPDKDNFLKGRRCESQGLGIGAFAYYRRVVENQKNRLLSEIIRVCRRTGASAEIIESLEAAKAETQFSKAIDKVKPAVPEVLKIDTHNPLTLLHTALSDGLHDQSEEHCLDLATAIRVVLFELAERIGQALKDEKELRTAVSKLLNAPTKS
jgi:hypothetical protein